MTDGPPPDLEEICSSPNNKLLWQVFKEISKRGRVQLTAWQTLVAYYLPRQYRSAQTNKLLDMAQRNLEKVERCFDLSRIIDTQ